MSKSVLTTKGAKRRGLLLQLAGEQEIRARLRDLESDLKQYEEKGHGGTETLPKAQSATVRPCRS